MVHFALKPNEKTQNRHQKVGIAIAHGNFIRGFLIKHGSVKNENVNELCNFDFFIIFFFTS